jgi:multimeric flavodoxin WrbA
MPTLLIAWHSRTGASKALAAAAADGARDAGDCAVALLPVSETKPEQLLAANAYLFVGPENLGSLSGAMKELLDTTYYPLLGRVEGRAYAHIIAAGSDGEGAARQLARIVTGWRLRAVADPLIVPMAAQTPEAILAPKVVPDAWLDRARELGAILAAGLAIGMF